jgi:hypothetical protein
MTTIEYLHASKYGNGVAVADELEHRMAAKGVTVDVHHIRDADPRHLPAADLYLFSAPGRFGRPIRRMRRFLEQLDLPAGTPYSVLTTEMAPRPDRKTGEVPDPVPGQKVLPVMNELLQAKGLRKVMDGTVHVTGLKGPLEDGWQSKVDGYADRLAELTPAA